MNEGATGDAFGLGVDIEVFESEGCDLDSAPQDPQDKHSETNRDLLNEHIESRSLDAELAFESFAGKVFDSNYSDELRSTQDSLSTADTNSPNLRFLSPLHRMKRLKQELCDFESDLLSLSMSGSKSHADTTAALLKEAEAAQSHLDTIFTQGLLPDGAVASLASSLQAVEGSESCTQPVQVRLVQDAVGLDRYWEQMQRLESRLAQLERLSGKASVGSLEFPFEDLLSCVTELESRFELLDTRQIQQLAVQCRELHPQLKEVQDTLEAFKEEQLDSAHIENLCSLSASLKRHDHIAHILPHILERLRTLQSLHELGADVIQRVSSLEKRADDVDHEINSINELVRKLESNLSECVSTVARNCASLQTRMERLSSPPPLPVEGTIPTPHKR